MKTQKLSFFRTLFSRTPFFRKLLSAALCCIFALPVTGFYAAATAAEKTPGLSKKIEQAIQQVNINTADAQTLSAVLKGIGIKKAQAIVDWRRQNGKFTNVSQLLEVKGIGEKTLSANRNRINL